MNHDELELLVSRLCEADARPEEWANFERVAESDPALWRVLAKAQHQHALLTAAVDRAASVADLIQLPLLRELAGSSVAGGGADTTRAGRGPQRGVDRAPLFVMARQSLFWAGWAAAAVVGVSWVVAWGVRNQSTRSTFDGADQSTQPLANFSPEQALQTYLAKGRESGLVLGEVPTKVLLEARPDPAGKGYELLYLRQVLERTLVPDLYEVEGEDEQGRPTLVRLERALDRPM